MKNQNILISANFALHNLKKYICHECFFFLDEQVWDQGMTFSLIEEYRKNQKDFHPFHGKMPEIVWETISINMHNKGIAVSSNSCEKKWRQLKKTFKFNHSKEIKTSKANWIFYESMKDIMDIEDSYRLIYSSKTLKRKINNTNTPKKLNLLKRKSQLNQAVYKPVDGDASGSSKHEIADPPKWFHTFLSNYREEERRKRKILQKMHSEIVQLEVQKCVLLEKLIKKMTKPETVPKIIDAVSLSQEVFEVESDEIDSDLSS